MAAMGEEMKGKAAEGNAQNVANAIWAFATLGAHATGGGKRRHPLRSCSLQSVGDARRQLLTAHLPTVCIC